MTDNEYIGRIKQIITCSGSSPYHYDSWVVMVNVAMVVNDWEEEREEKEE